MLGGRSFLKVKRCHSLPVESAQLSIRETLMYQLCISTTGTSRCRSHPDRPGGGLEEAATSLLIIWMSRMLHIFTKPSRLPVTSTTPNTTASSRHGAMITLELSIETYHAGLEEFSLMISILQTLRNAFNLSDLVATLSSPHTFPWSGKTRSRAMATRKDSGSS